jgi:hypothetical protein
MKFKIAVALGVLFALAPMAAPKGRSQGLSFFASCDSTDTAQSQAQGLPRAAVMCSPSRIAAT